MSRKRRDAIIQQQEVGVLLAAAMDISKARQLPLVNRLVLNVKTTEADMPATFTYPGVYLEEAPSGARTIDCEFLVPFPI